jgi:hypothetical protein
MLPPLFGSVVRRIRAAPRKFSNLVRSASSPSNKDGGRLAFPAGKSGIKALKLPTPIEHRSVPATDGNHHFIELNDKPDLKAHCNPGEGKPRDVAGAIVDYLTTRCWRGSRCKSRPNLIQAR